MATKTKPKDNSTLRRKVSLRRMALEALDIPLPAEITRASLVDFDPPVGEPDPTIEPIIMETHGGYGRIYLDVYRHVRRGVVFELDQEKSDALAEQRPTWAVYQADCVRAIRAGAGAHLPVNLLDVDPYWEPWQVLDAFFSSERPRPDRLVVVVNDGLRRNVRFGMAWHVGSLADVVEQFGNDLFDRYLDVCQVLMTKIAVQAGYRLDRFTGYYCGEKNQMTHYLAVFNREV